jgi:hypothetical protein
MTEPETPECVVKLKKFMAETCPELHTRFEDLLNRGRAFVESGCCFPHRLDMSAHLTVSLGALITIHNAHLIGGTTRRTYLKMTREVLQNLEKDIVDKEKSKSQADAEGHDPKFTQSRGNA